MLLVAVAINCLSVLLKSNTRSWSKGTSRGSAVDNPGYALLAYWVMGKAYQALNQSENACDAFGRSFAIQKDNPDVAREYMFECLNLGRTAEAIDAARHGVELSPNDAGLVANLALAYLVGGQIDEAVTAIDKSLKIAPDDKITQDLRTIILEVRDGKRPQPKSLREL